MKKILFTLTIIMAAVSCNNTNPLLSDWNTPYGIPDFNSIKEKH